MTSKLFLSLFGVLVCTSTVRAQLMCYTTTDTDPFSYTCLGNSFVSGCATGLPIVPSFVCADSPEVGGSATNTQCYPGIHKKLEICGAPQPVCTMTGTFPAQGTRQCTHFYVCINKGGSFEQIMRSCPSGLEFNPRTKTCVAGGCSAPPAKQCFPLSRQKDITSCVHYYVCNLPGNSFVRQQCPQGLFFDEVFMLCKPTQNCNGRLLPN